MATAKRKYSFGLVSRLGVIAAFVGLGSWAVFNSQFKKSDDEEVAKNEDSDDKENAEGDKKEPNDEKKQIKKSSDEVIKDNKNKKASFVEENKPNKIDIVKPDKNKKSNSSSFSFGSNKNSGPPSSQSFSMNDDGKKKDKNSSGFSPPSSKSFTIDSKNGPPKSTFDPTSSSGSGFPGKSGGIGSSNKSSNKKSSSKKKSENKSSGSGFTFNPKSSSSGPPSSGPPSTTFDPTGSAKSGSSKTGDIAKSGGGFSMGDNKKSSNGSGFSANNSSERPSSTFNPSGSGTFSPGKSSDSSLTKNNGAPSSNFGGSSSFASNRTPANDTNSSSNGGGFKSKLSSGNERPLRGGSSGFSKNDTPKSSFTLSNNKSPANNNSSFNNTGPNNSFNAGSGNSGLEGSGSGNSGSGFSLNNNSGSNGTVSKGNAFQDKGSKPLPRKSPPPSSGLVESNGKSSIGSSSSSFADIKKGGFPGGSSGRPGTSLDPGSAAKNSGQGRIGNNSGFNGSGAPRNFSGNSGLAGGSGDNRSTVGGNQKIGRNSVDPKTTFGSDTTSKPNPNLSKLPQGGTDDRKPGPVSLEGIQAPAVTLQKLSPREIQVNVESSFKLVVRNVGRANATNVTVVDPIPDGMEFVNSDPRPTDRGVDGSLIWKFGSLGPNEQKVITVNVLPKRQGELGSVARMSFQSAATAKSVCTKPEISLSHRGPQKVLVGQVAQFLVTVQNNGDGVARNVMIEDEVPAGFAFGEGKGSRLAYEVGNLPPGAKRDVVLKLRAVEPGRYVNEVRAKMGKSISSNHKLDVEVVSPKLAMEIIGPTRRYIQREANYKIEVQNTGTASAKNVLMVTRLPRGLKFVGTNNQGQYNPREHSVYWSMVELSPQNKGSVELRLMPIGTGQQDIEFEARSLIDRTKLKKFPVVVDQLAELFFEVDDRDDPIEVNGETEYRIRVVNQGSKAATNVQINVEMPMGIQATNTQGPTKGSLAGQVVKFTPVASLAPRGELIYKIKARGTRDGDHLIKVMLSSNERREAVAKQESTKVYSEYR